MPHLRRLQEIWINDPVFFITTCTKDRRKVLTHPSIAAMLIEEWKSARERHGWVVGTYVIMPDHVHFFCTPERESVSLSRFMQAWKEWTSKKVLRSGLHTESLWQSEFFDHLIRSSKSYDEKWHYVVNNPVRAGLVAKPEDWRWHGEIIEF